MNATSIQEASETGYLQSCANHDLLMASKEDQLAKKIRSGSLTAKNDLVASNRRLALKLAQSHRSYKIEFMDRLSAAMEGLIIAAGNFDPSSGKFSTYAYQRIRERLQHQLCMSSTVYIPIRQAKMLYSPSTPDNERAELKAAISPMDAMPEEALSGTNQWESRLLDTLSVKKGLCSLDDRSQTIIALRYGLRGRGPFTQREVGKILGYSSSSISDIQNNALEALKQVLSN